MVYELKDGLIESNRPRCLEDECVVDNFGTIVNDLADPVYAVIPNGVQRDEKEITRLLERACSYRQLYERGQKCCKNVEAGDFVQVKISGHANYFWGTVLDITRRTLKIEIDGNEFNWPLTRVAECNKEELPKHLNEETGETYEAQAF